VYIMSGEEDERGVRGVVQNVEHVVVVVGLNE
jgi:hypothetical protein